MLSEGHVGDIDQPAGAQIIGELCEILAKVLDGQTRAPGFGMDRRGLDRKDARAFTSAHNAVFVLADSERGHALHVDQRVEPVGRQSIVIGDLRSDLREVVVNFLRFSLGEENHRLLDLAFQEERCPRGPWP